MNKKNIKLINKKKISQNYLAIGEEEIRIRKIIDESEENASYFMTYKKGNSLKRIEQEIEILKETYDQLQGNLKPINKTRSTFKFNNYLIYVDEYDDFDFCTIEIEFDSVEESLNFVPPSWFGEEITANKDYKNQSLWLKLNFKAINLT